MNDNNSTDRLTVMSYCAEFDMGRRIQAIRRPSGKYSGQVKLVIAGRQAQS